MNALREIDRDPDPIRRAQTAAARAAIVTPLVRSHDLDARARGAILLKPESLQRTGSFKFRAAYFRLTELAPDERRRGVVTYSSGNFGKALACAGGLLGVAVTIVVPSDAPAAKVDGARALGASILVSHHGSENREAAAARLAERTAAESGAVLLHPFEDELLLAGHAALIRELDEQARAAGAPLDALIVPCGGGGLAAGCCLALRGAASFPRIYAVEPAGYDGMARSLAARARTRVAGGAPSICDALQAAEPGRLAFAATMGALAGAVTVSEEEVRSALRYAADTLKLVIEPSAAAALAAVLEGKIATAGATTAVVLTGGNVDPIGLGR